MSLKIRYLRGDMFMNAEEGALLLHACNSMGVWGRGVALSFKARFPKSYRQYQDYCKKNGIKGVGTTFVTFDGVACLISSGGFSGVQLDPPEKISAATEMALKDLFSSYRDGSLVKIASPLINYNLFKTPWKMTVAAIEAAAVNYPNLEIEWQVSILSQDETPELSSLIDNQ